MAATDAPPRAASNLIRKSSYGRTELFLPSESHILREVKCMGGITRYERANVYHVLPEVRRTASASTPVCCWHCCEDVCNPSEVVPLPRMYDSTERLYHVYGATCSPGCAKAYILEHTTFDRGQHLNVLTKMLRDVYGFTDTISETPPRPALRRFGGVFEPRKARRPVECRIVEPPFVSYCMMVEERNRDHVLTEVPQWAGQRQAPEEADTFEEPQPPALFDEYLRARQAEEDEGGGGGGGGGGSRKRPAPPPTPPPAPTGPLSKFVRIEGES